MPKVILCGHDHINSIYDVVRMYYESARIDGSSIFGGEDGLLIFSMIEDGTVLTKWEQDGECHEIKALIAGHNEKREVKRQIYEAFVSITGISFPWGSLTGIRPTLIAAECKNDISRLTDYYFVSEAKASLAIETCIHEERIQGDLPPERPHCYIGIPFCSSRCLYCSFVSEETGRLEKWIPDYVDALIKEISVFLPRIKDRIQSLYIGGGTPTSLSDDQFEKLLREISKHLSGTTLEYTVEAGRADSISLKKLETMMRYGVNRLCINPQTMQDSTLRRIGRSHTARQVEDAYALARGCRFDTINMDLIAGLPGECFLDFKSSLDALIRLDPENITVHTLSLKRNSTLTKTMREDDPDEETRIQQKQFHIPSREISDMIEYSRHELKKHGYHPYYLYRQKDMAGGHENVGYSKDGHECLYNVAMMGDRNSVLAMGAGAMSKRVVFEDKAFRMERMPNLKDVRAYIQRINELIEKKKRFFDL